MNTQWIPLTSEQILEEAIQASFEKPVIIFKHSTTCGISQAAYYELDKNFEKIADLVQFYYLDLLQYRPISNKVVEVTEVIHQSPQVLLLSKGKVVYSVTHYAINTDKIAQAIHDLTA